MCDPNSSEQPKRDASESEFADLNVMFESVSPEVAFLLVEKYYKYLPNKKEILKQRAEQHCDVEFVL